MEVNVETRGHAKSHTEVGVESGQLCCRRHVERRLTKEVVLPVPATYSATSIRPVGSLMMLYYHAWLHANFPQTDSSQGTEVTSPMDMHCADWRDFGKTAATTDCATVLGSGLRQWARPKFPNLSTATRCLSHMTVRRKTAVCASYEQDQDPSWSCSQAVSIPVWHIPLLCVQWKTPDDGQRNCPRN